MIAEARLDILSKSERDEAMARIVALVGRIEREPSRVPAWWELGEALVSLDCPLHQKYHLAHGHSNYYQASNVYYRFPSLDRARAYQGSLNSLLRSMRKGIKGREPASVVEKALKAFLDAVDGNPEKAVRLVIERHWNFADALDWAQREAERKGIMAMPSSF